MRRCAIVLTLILLPAAAFAHELRLERMGGDLVLLYGHDAADPGYALADVDTLLRWDLAGRSLPAAAGDSLPLRLAGGGAASYARICTGYWTRTLYGMRNQPKDAVEHPLGSRLVYQAVKRLDAWSEALAGPLTANLELVPLDDPFALSTGDTLRLAVMRGGRPVADALLSYRGKRRGISGLDGRLAVRLEAAGPVLLQVRLLTPLDSVKADEQEDVSGLMFDLPATKAARP
jgi:nickel transport protein